MKRRIFSVLLAVVMILSLLPAMAVSAEVDPIQWPEIGEAVTIDGVEFTYVGDGSEGLSFTEVPSGNEAYKAGDGAVLAYTQTNDSGDYLYLELLNATINAETTALDISTYTYCEIYASGENQLNASQCGIYASGDCYIYGDALEINIEGEGFTGNGIYCAGSYLDLTGLMAEINIDQQEVEGIYAYDLYLYGCLLKINGKSNAEYFSGSLIECENLYTYWGAELDLKGDNLYTAIGLGYFDSDGYAEFYTETKVNIEMVGDPASEDWCYPIDSYADILIVDSVLNIKIDSNYGTAIWSSGKVDIKDGSVVMISGEGAQIEGIFVTGDYNGGNGYVNSSKLIVDESTVMIDVSDWAMYGGDLKSIVLSRGMNVLTPAQGDIGTVEYTVEYDVMPLSDEGYTEYYCAVMDANGEAASKVLISPYVFKDVKTTDWFAKAVYFNATRGIMSGTSATTFAPAGKASRVMMMAVLGRLGGMETTGAGWDVDAINWAMANGVSDGTNPNGNITREQVAMMLWNFVGSPEATADLSGFTDAGAISGWAADAVNWAVAEGIISGNAGRLNPKGDITRMELAQIFYSYLAK